MMDDKSKMPTGKDKQAMMEEMAMKKGKTGSTKKYAKGGKVRGAGCATKGTRAAKIV
jgi:hypothetical protein